MRVQDRVVNIYKRTGDIDPFALVDFTEKTGIRTSLLCFRQPGDAVSCGDRASLPRVRLLRRRGASCGRAKAGVSVRYAVSEEGAEIGFYMLAIRPGAAHKDEAMAFVDFVLRSDILTRITGTARYPNAVRATRVFVRP